MIILAIIGPGQKEVHVKYDGHDSVESAYDEIDVIREQLMKGDKVPFDCYIYEADVPRYGCRLFTVDEIDFNFYVEKTEEEKRESAIAFNKKLAKIRELAQKEQKKFGGKKVV